MCDNPDDAENLRTDYSSLCNYYGNVISWRFTTLGLFMAAVGLIVSGDHVKCPGILLVMLSLVTWLIEVRNRIAFHDLRNRANEIAKVWKMKSEVSHQNSKCFDRSTVDAGFQTTQTEIRMLFFKVCVQPRGLIARTATHTVGIDVLLIFVFGYGLFLIHPLVLVSAIALTLVVVATGLCLCHHCHKRKNTGDGPG